MAQIGKDTEFFIFVGDDKCDAVDGIVRGGDGFDGCVTKRQCVSGIEMPDVAKSPEITTGVESF